MVDLPNARRMEIESTEIGIDAETVSPARRPTYTDTAPNSAPKIAPRITARQLNSVIVLDASTYGRNSAGGAVELQGLVAKKHLRERFRSESRPRMPQRQAPRGRPALWTKLFGVRENFEPGVAEGSND